MRTLRLDLDGKYGLSTFLERTWILKYLGIKVVGVKIHHTMNGFHARLVCDNEIDNVKAAFIQALLGSDYRRELSNLLKIERGRRTGMCYSSRSGRPTGLAMKCLSARKPTTAN